MSTCTRLQRLLDKDYTCYTNVNMYIPDIFFSVVAAQVRLESCAYTCLCICEWVCDSLYIASQLFTYDFDAGFEGVGSQNDEMLLESLYT